jgi:hypothetical protein
VITRAEAEAIVYQRINLPDPYWPEKPEMVITQVDERELGWVVYYDSRRHLETGDFRDALAGNAPYLVVRDDGSLWETGTAPPIEARIREAEQRFLAQRRAPPS